jgi:hypothetical protein
MKAGVDKEPQPDHTIVRPAQTLIAVNADMAGIDRDRIASMFEECGAWQIEIAEGTWTDGEWTDFNPVVPPNLIGGHHEGPGLSPTA